MRRPGKMGGLRSQGQARVRDFRADSGNTMAHEGFGLHNEPSAVSSDADTVRAVRAAAETIATEPSQLFVFCSHAYKVAQALPVGHVKGFSKFHNLLTSSSITCLQFSRYSSLTWTRC